MSQPVGQASWPVSLNNSNHSSVGQTIVFCGLPVTVLFDAPRLSKFEGTCPADHKKRWSAPQPHPQGAVEPVGQASRPASSNNSNHSLIPMTGHQPRPT